MNESTSFRFAEIANYDGSDRAAMRDSLRGIPFSWKSEWVSQPVFVEHTSFQELGTVATRMVGIIRDSYLSLGRNTSERAERIGVNWEFYRRSFPFFLEESLESRWADSIARPDLVATPHGIRFLEANVGAAVGGIIQTDLLRSFWLRRRSGIRDPEPEVMTGLADLVSDVARNEGVEPRVAVLGLPEFNAPDMRGHYRAEADALLEKGIDAEPVTPQRLLELQPKGGPLPWPIAIRRNRHDRWAESSLGIGPLEWVISKGCLAMAPQSAYLMADKRLLGLISSGSIGLTKEDASFVDEHLPWTRIVRPSIADFRGSRARLESLLIALQPSFVLKRGSGRGGIGVVIGSQTSASDWGAAVDQAMASGEWIAQELQNTLTATLPSVDQTGRIDRKSYSVVFSPFVIQGRSYGCMTRTLEIGDEAIVSVATGAELNIALPSVLADAVSPGGTFAAETGSQTRQGAS